MIPGSRSPTEPTEPARCHRSAAHPRPPGQRQQRSPSTTAPGPLSLPSNGNGCPTLPPGPVPAPPAPSQAFAAPRRPPTAAAKRHRSAHPALTARQGSADNALSRHLWPTGQSAVDDLCGRGHEAPPPAARQSLSERSNRTTRVEKARMTAGPADYVAQPEEGRCARVTLATAVAVAALQPAMLAEC